MDEKNPSLLSPDEGIEFLYSLEKFGMKMDLDNIGALMDFAGNPHRSLKAVHVAGTNGKGSTCAAIASVLTAQGYRVGLYTSPHIVSFTERIKINGAQISDAEVSELSGYFHDEIVRLRATFFEAATALMFKYFADNAVDIAVIETGLGGRLDATNIVDPMISVITSIGLDHTEILGDTLEKIAAEKAGIIKSRRPAVVNVYGESVRRVFSNAATERSAKLIFVDDAVSASNVKSEIDSCIFDAVVFDERFDSLKLDVGGEHQARNGMTVLTSLKILNEAGIPVSRKAIFDGLASIRRNTGHRGRLEVISRNPLIILDVAHNPDGINALLKSLPKKSDMHTGILLFAAMRDKDVFTMLSSLRERFQNVILTQLRTGRSLGVAELKKLSDSIKLQSQVFDNSTDALRAALSQTSNDSFLLITGSHYLAGEVLPTLEKSATGSDVP